MLSLMLVTSNCLPLAAQGADPMPPLPVPTQLNSEIPPPIPGQAESRTSSVPPVERVAPGRYQLGQIQIDKTDRTVSFPAELNMDQGLLEYLLVRSGGKTHESLLRTRTEPYHLQLACLLLGLEGSKAPLTLQGAPELPTGDQVEISLRLADGRTVSSEQWMMHSIEGARREVPKVSWVFTGSRINNGNFAAQAEGSIIAVYHDPAAMIDNASPGGETDKIWYVREGATPPVGTPVTVVIKAVK